LLENTSKTLATDFNYRDELNLLRRALSEPVRQLIVVEYDNLQRLQPALNEIIALDPDRPSLTLQFDPRTDDPLALLAQARSRLPGGRGERPPLLLLVCADVIEETPEAPQSTRFWKNMNLAREAWDSLEAQTVLFLPIWSYRLARLHADHLMSWVSMRIHLLSSQTPGLAEREALPSISILGNFGISPALARERWPELYREWREADARKEPPESFASRFFIPLLEKALAMGDLVKAREVRDELCAHTSIPDRFKARWHELNLALALASHDPDLADEHARKLLDLAENHPDESIRQLAIQSVQRQGHLLYQTGHYLQSETLMRRALALDEKTFDPDHPNVALALNNLAMLLQTTNRMGEAEPLMRRALAIDEKNLGPDHPSVAIRLNNLATLLQDTNRLVEAEPLMRRALAIGEKSFEPDLPTAAIRLNNLAQLLRATNRLAEAEPLLRRALAIGEKSFGPDHPRIATVLNNLALLLQDINRLAEAEPLMRRAVAIDEKSFGPDHPEVAVALNNLALLLEESNRLAEAEPLLRRALAIAQKSFGPDHPDVAVALNNLAQLLKATNRLAEAEPLICRALAICEKGFGPDHPRVAIALNNVATLLHTSNRLAEAEPLYRRALSITEKSFGPDHPGVATDLNNLAQLLKATNRLAEAEPLICRALAIAEKSFGPDHPTVAGRLNNLAQLLKATNRLAEAEPLMRRGLAIFLKSTRTTGHPHPHLETVLGNYKSLLHDMGHSESEINLKIDSLQAE
jgi:tetratricopeptide (TPR) repeat protein